VIQREISRVLVLNPSGEKSGATALHRISLSLTPPSLLSRGTRQFVPGQLAKGARGTWATRPDPTLSQKAREGWGTPVYPDQIPASRKKREKGGAPLCIQIRFRPLAKKTREGWGTPRNPHPTSQRALP